MARMMRLFLYIFLLSIASLSAGELTDSLKMAHEMPPVPQALLLRASNLVPNQSYSTSSASDEVLNSQRIKLAKQLTRALTEHQLISAYAAERDVASAQQGAERSGLFPKLSTRFSSGVQDYKSQNIPSRASTNTKERSVSASQVLWDFGATMYGIERAGKQLSSADTELELQRQNLLFQAIESVLNLSRATQSLAMGRIYESQLNSIAEFEKEKIIAGRGLVTDLEQAGSQFELSKSRSEVLVNGYHSARYHFESLFLEPPAEDFLLSVLPDAQDLPGSLNGLIVQVESGNYELRNALMKIDIRRDERSQVRAKDFLPRVDLQVDSSQRDNFDGVLGAITNQKMAVVASWNYDIGNRSGYILDSMDSSIRAEAARAELIRKQVIEDAKYAWISLQTAKQRLLHLESQRTHAERFVEFIKIEREFGRRTLLEVLNAELQLLNVQTDIIAAVVDRKMAGFKILKSMGALNFASLYLVSGK